MQYYFFLAAPGVQAEVTLSNFPPASCATQLSECFVCSAIAQDDRWILRTICNIAPNQSLVLNGQILNLDEETLRRTLVFLARKPMQGDYPELPMIKDFSSWPEWRANLRIRAPRTSVSYQGEYPSPMLNVKNGTFVSISGMLQNAPGLQNKFFLVNYTSKPIKDFASLEFHSLPDGKLIKKMQVMTNQVSCLDVSDIFTEGQSSELILVSSKAIHGIPLYFSHDEGYFSMSLEHTHPPVEMTVFGEASAGFSIARRMKDLWLDYLK